MARKFLSGVSTNAFQLGTSATSGQVLTTDTSGNGTWQPASGGGTGDVVGPASATDNAVTRFDATTGKLVQNSLVTISDLGDITMPTAQTATLGFVSFNGGTTSGANISLTTGKITAMADPTNPQDGATKNYVDAGVTTFTGAKTFNNGKLIVAGATSGTTTLNATATASGTLTFPAATSTLAGLAIAQTWTAAQSFNSGNFKLNGATSGATTLNAAATAGATTATLPATTGNILVDAATQTNTAAKTFNSSTLLLAGATSGTTTLNATAAASGVLTLPAATDTLVGKATTDTFTNKTYDTAGTGNVFKINGTTVSAVTGTGAAVLATSPVITTGTVAANPTVALGIASKQYVDALGVWTTWTPSPTAASGSFTVTTIYSRYTQIGKTVIFQAEFNLSAFTTTGNVVFAPPVAPLQTSAMVGSAYEYAATGVMGSLHLLSATQIVTNSYNNTGMMTASISKIVCHGTYEAA
jgi:hypothetical protein